MSPTHDEDGNATTWALRTDGLGSSTQSDVIFVWDGENRLIEIKDAAGATTLASYTYDSQSRRIARTVGGTTLATIYDGWNPIAEYSGTPATGYSLQASYSWGLDLSGSMQGAGGVGGLLSVTSTAGTYYPTYDGNGNVSEYLDAAGAIAAHYEYDAFGNIIFSSGPSASSFRHRFSTKPQDAESGLYYYGYRYYDPVTGRWPSRDPIGERGGMNLYGFVFNQGTKLVDLLGLELPVSKPSEAQWWLNWELGGSLVSKCPPHRSDGTCEEVSMRFFDFEFSQFEKSARNLGLGPVESNSAIVSVFPLESIASMLETIDQNLERCQCLKVLTIFAHGPTDKSGNLIGGISIGGASYSSLEVGRTIGKALSQVMCDGGSIVLPNCGTAEGLFMVGLALGLATEGSGASVIGVWNGITGTVIIPKHPETDIGDIITPSNRTIDEITVGPDGGVTRTNIFPEVVNLPGTTIDDRDVYPMIGGNGISRVITNVNWR
jgi:RHS repeat-associated protein